MLEPKTYSYRTRDKDSKIDFYPKDDNDDDISTRFASKKQDLVAMNKFSSILFIPPNRHYLVEGELQQ